ncbi:conserved protein of unknown function [Hyphomicrobium sp. 1Nfss2.1]|uniref:hypothetical protein n=1 Tax=Hyphomicrobium sp. 1Nfss2.1 TaxID=3413936 RepID=UPI003C7C8A2B
MPPKKRRVTAAANRPAAARNQSGGKAAKPQRRRRSKTQPLAITDTVRRGPVAGAAVANPLLALEPLRRSLMDRQAALVGLAMAWSPAHVLIDQHAAFWAGVARANKPMAAPARRAGSVRRKASGR